MEPISYNYNLTPPCGATEAREVTVNSYRNEEKCSVCGQERLGHKAEHKFKAKWEDIDIMDAQDVLKEIKKTRKEDE